MPRHGSTMQRRQAQAGYAFVSPFFLFFGVFGFLPILYTAYVAFFNWDLLGTQEFIGLQNFRDLLADSRFYEALRNTVGIFLLSSVPQLIIALGLALALNRPDLRFRTFWRAVVLFPFITSTVAVAVVFGAMFSDHGGMVNWALGYLHVGPLMWHADALPGWIAIAVMVNWRWIGYNCLLYLAALQAIPKELYEAAEVDGANSWHRFLHITIPQIRPTLFFTIITSTIGGLQIFAEPFQFGGGNYSGGSAGQFRTLTLFLFDQAFGQMKLGYASAVAIVLFIIIAAIVGVNALVSSRFVKGDN